MSERVPEIIFKQGLEYYKKGRVKITNRDQSSVVSMVRGTDSYIVRLTSDGKNFESVCTCPYSYVCKHAVATAFAVIEDHDHEDEIENISNWREYFEKIIAIQRVNSDFSEEVRWKLIYIIHVLENYWNLQPMKVYMKKDGTFGRTQEPSYNELSQQNVSSNSSDLITISYLERIQSQQNSTYYRGRLESLYLNFGMNSGKIFNLLRNSEIHIRNEDGEIGHRIRFGRKPWNLVFKLEELNNHYAFQPFFVRDDKEIKIDHNMKILTTQPIWFYHEGKLHTSLFAHSYSYLQSFIDESIRVTFSKEEYKTMISDYLSKLPIFPYLEFPENIDVKELNTVTGKRIYLEEMDEQLVVSLAILYDDVEVSFNQGTDQFLHYDQKNSQITRVRRQKEIEEQIREEINDSDIIEDTPGLFYANLENALDWLFDGLPKLLKSEFEILGEEKLVRFKVRRRKPSINMAVSSEIDWFDLNLEIDFDGVSLTLAELKKSLKQQKKFVKLKDGSIARLPEKLLQKFQYLVEFGQANKNSLRFQDCHLTFVDKILNEADKKELDNRSKRKLKKLEKFTEIEDQPIPANFKGELRFYQKAGYNWLYFLKDFSFGGCLADDMGLGKTVQALVFLQSEINQKRTPNLIVSPTSVLFNWQREIEKFTPEIEFVIHYGSKRTRDVRRLRNKQLILTTYGHLRRDISFLKNIDFHYVILDESQNIKNPDSETAHAACGLLSKHKLTLTGTPVENNTLDLWSQFAFVNPGLLGSQIFFKENFMRPIEKEQDVQVGATLKKLIFPYILRRTKEEVVKELPPKIENTIYSPMSDRQQVIYDKIKETYRNTILAEIKEKGLNKSKMRVLEGLTKLRQVSCHPALVDSSFYDEAGKFEALKLMIDGIISENHKVLVFSQFVRMLHIIRNFLEEEAIEFTYLDGSTKNRSEVVDKFQEDESVRIFLISLKAGGIGLNLTAADYVIHYDPWWNPAVEMQATDRAHRIGQDKKVFAYKLITKDSVEEKILKLQQYKTKLVKQLITTEGGFFKTLGKEDIISLFE